MNVMLLISLGIKISIFLLVFSLGLGATFDNISYIKKRPGQIIRSLFSMNIIMPLVAVLLSIAFELHLSVKIALIATAVSPVPPILPRKELAAGGTKDYVFALLITAVLCSIFFVPFSLSFIGKSFGIPIHIPGLAIAKIVFMTVLIPLGTGILVRKISSVFANRYQKMISKIATVILVLSALPIIIVSWHLVQDLFFTGAVMVFVVFCVVALVVGHILGGPGENNRTVLALSTMSRHPGVTIAIGRIGFPNENHVVAAVLLLLLVGAIISKLYLVWHERHISHGPGRLTGTPV